LNPRKAWDLVVLELLQYVSDVAAVAYVSRCSMDVARCIDM